MMVYVLYGIGGWVVASAVLVALAGLGAGRRDGAVARGRARWADSLEAPLSLWTDRPAPVTRPRPRA